MKNSTLKQLAVNAIVAALYTVLTLVFSFMSFGAIQFRVSEILNHLVVFNKKYFWGIIVGVFVINLLISPMPLLDIIFGTLHSGIALLVTIMVSKKFKSKMGAMIFNAFSFAVFSFFIALMIVMIDPNPSLGLFFFFYATVAFGELVVMLIGAPIMKWLDQIINFDRQMNSK